MLCVQTAIYKSCIVYYTFNVASGFCAVIYEFMCTTGQGGWSEQSGVADEDSILWSLYLHSN